VPAGRRSNQEGLPRPAKATIFNFGHCKMKRFDERTAANLDVVLDDVCRSLPNNGGDHESRKYVAAKLLRAAQRGKKTLGALEVVARNALHALSRGRPA
jgi:hypothetical protein